jgi:3-deoxy-D-arabino-heptulosonate 7-phosphate (DAHP) synthase class II
MMAHPEREAADRAEAEAEQREDEAAGARVAYYDSLEALHLIVRMVSTAKPWDMTTVSHWTEKMVRQSERCTEYRDEWEHNKRAALRARDKAIATRSWRD